MSEAMHPFYRQLYDSHLAVRRHVFWLQREAVVIPPGHNPLSALLSYMEVAGSILLDPEHYPATSVVDIEAGMARNIQLLSELEANSASIYPQPATMRLDDIKADTILGTIAPMLLVGPGLLPDDDTPVTARQAQLLILEALELSGPSATFSEGMNRIRAKYGLGILPYSETVMKICQAFISEPLKVPFEEPWHESIELEIGEAWGVSCEAQVED